VALHRYSSAREVGVQLGPRSEDSNSLTLTLILTLILTLTLIEGQLPGFEPGGAS